MIKSMTLRGVLSVVLVLGILAVGLGGFGMLASLREPPVERENVVKRLNVEAFRVESLDLLQYLKAFGTAKSEQEVVISAEVPGRVTKIHERLEVGEEVLAPRYQNDPQVPDTDDELRGDELVQIDQDIYLQRVEQAQSKIAETEVELARLIQEEKNSKKIYEQVKKDYNTSLDDFKRREDLVRKGVSSKSELTRITLELQTYEKAKLQSENELALFPIREKQLQERIKSLETEKKIAKEDLERTSVVPPFSGFLSEVHVELGQFLRVGDPIVKLTDLRKVEIPVSLTLSDYAKLKPLLVRGINPKATLALHQSDPAKWRGEVVRIAPNADEQTRTIQIFIEVDNQKQDVPLLPGTFVFAKIQGPRHEAGQVFAVPRDAILDDRVYVIRDGKAYEKTVHVRANLQSVALVDEGLSENDLLVLTNLDVLTDETLVDQGERIRSLSEELTRSGTRMANLVIIDDEIERLISE